MFELYVFMRPRIKGLKALDERRRLGLPDGTELGNEGTYAFTCEVNEAFARDFADKYLEKKHMVISVPSSSFKKKELIVDPFDKSCVERGPALTLKRLRVLAKESIDAEVKKS